MKFLLPILLIIAVNFNFAYANELTLNSNNQNGALLILKHKSNIKLHIYCESTGKLSHLHHLVSSLNNQILMDYREDDSKLILWFANQRRDANNLNKYVLSIHNCNTYYDYSRYNLD